MGGGRGAAELRRMRALWAKVAGVVGFTVGITALLFQVNVLHPYHHSLSEDLTSLRSQTRELLERAKLRVGRHKEEAKKEKADAEGSSGRSERA